MNGYKNNTEARFYYNKNKWVVWLEEMVEGTTKEEAEAVANEKIETYNKVWEARNK